MSPDGIAKRCRLMLAIGLIITLSSIGLAFAADNAQTTIQAAVIPKFSIEVGPESIGDEVAWEIDPDSDSNQFSVGCNFVVKNNMNTGEWCVKAYTNKADGRLTDLESNTMKNPLQVRVESGEFISLNGPTQGDAEVIYTGPAGRIKELKALTYQIVGDMEDVPSDSYSIVVNYILVPST